MVKKMVKVRDKGIEFEVKRVEAHRTDNENGKDDPFSKSLSWREMRQQIRWRRREQI